MQEIAVAWKGRRVPASGGAVAERRADRRAIDAAAGTG